MRIILIPFIFFLLLLSSISSYSQQYNNWYFGSGAGISFNAHINPMVPYPIPGGKLDTWEGSSCISDENGNLLFYTDGVNIYNKQHKIMTGGDALMGNKSAYQAAVILQQPKNDSIYYIITADAIENNFANG